MKDGLERSKFHTCTQNSFISGGVKYNQVSARFDQDLRQITNLYTNKYQNLKKKKLCMSKFIH